jgi:hypothetical protein
MPANALSAPAARLPEPAADSAVAATSVGFAEAAAPSFAC